MGVSVTGCEEVLSRLREAESSVARYRALLESAAEAVVAMDSAGNVLLVNQGAERMFGYGREEWSGMRLETLVPGEVVAGPEACRGKLQLTGYRKDGSSFPVEIALSLAEAGGEALVLALLSDITGRKRLEARLRETQRLVTVGLLAGGVAHDFNNLLTAILGNASLMAEEIPDPGSPHLTAVIAVAEKAALVTRQLLSYARKGPFEARDLELSALIDENADLVRASIPKRIEIRFDLARHLPSIHADPGQLQQVLVNLALNAGEAIDETKSGAIAIATGEETAGTKRYVRLTVRDNGCGMSDDTRARIFDPFFTTKAHGRGLGMSAVLAILRSFAGTIDIDTAAGKGTTVRLLFPAGEAEAAPVRRATILLVENDVSVRAFAAAALDRSGYEVVEVADSREALDAIRAGRAVDLIILDATMRLMSGSDALEQIWALRPDLNVMVTSSQGSDEARRLLQTAGMRPAFLEKPYNARQLVGAVASCLPR